jgi:hypothetical protein
VNHCIFISIYRFDGDDDDNDDDRNKFLFFVSTKRLIRIASTSKKIHADATYKLVWQGFPVFIVGTTDLDRQFHSFGIAVCSNEKSKISHLFFVLFKMVSRNLIYKK